MSFKKSVAREYFESMVIAVIMALFVRTWAVQAFKIPTGSMELNLLVGDHLLVNKFVYAPSVTWFERSLLPMGEVERGDVLVFKYPQDPERDFIKRVVGLPGETIELRRSRVLIDGELIEEPYLDLMRPGGRLPPDLMGTFGPMFVPEGHVFMMGDNRGDSQDSRYWGSLPLDHVKGRAFVLYWSYDADSEFYADVGIGATARRIFSAVTHFFTRTRWDRLLMSVD
ncbi:MAG: signal peptidase I [Acidobacteria bacterium]|nr:signal peptidase I [Acidobacteriota bacterium]|tara:strand:+ start:25613 stop:26290 length:678 start_codon:yes stop_codon:yes gene_type:complete